METEELHVCVMFHFKGNGVPFVLNMEELAAESDDCYQVLHVGEKPECEYLTRKVAYNRGWNWLLVWKWMKFYREAVNSLVISQDGTYPGIVTHMDRLGWAIIKWYKWGYKSRDQFGSDFMDAEHVHEFRVSPIEIKNRFGGLPPEYKEVL